MDGHYLLLVIPEKQKKERKYKGSTSMNTREIGLKTVTILSVLIYHDPS